MAHAALGEYVGQNYLKSNAGLEEATDYEKRILAITALGENPRNFTGQDFVARLKHFYDGTQMGARDLLNDDIFGLLALHSVSENGEIISKLRAHILKNQNSDGGWGYSTKVKSDSNTTAMAAAALAQTGGGVPNSALSYLSRSRVSGSGYAYSPGGQPDGASTAWVIMGLRAAGQIIPTEAKQYLESLQNSDGSFRWNNASKTGSGLVTAYAVTALAGKSYPLRTVSAVSVTTPAPQPAPPVPAGLTLPATPATSTVVNNAPSPIPPAMPSPPSLPVPASVLPSLPSKSVEVSPVLTPAKPEIVLPTPAPASLNTNFNFDLSVAFYCEDRSKPHIVVSWRSMPEAIAYEVYRDEQLLISDGAEKFKPYFSKSGWADNSIILNKNYVYAVKYRTGAELKNYAYPLSIVASCN